MLHNGYISHNGFNFNSILRCEKTFQNDQESPLMQDVQLLGYNDGTYCMLINPVNDITAIAIKKKIKTSDTTLSVRTCESAPRFIQINIYNANDLFACFKLIESIEHMPKSWYKDITKTFYQFLDQDIKEIRHYEFSKERELRTEEKQLFTAIDDCDYQTVKLLLENGISPNLTPQHGKSPLLSAVWNYVENKRWKRFPHTEYLKIIKSLLDYLADVRAKHEWFDHTALTVAAEHDEVELVNLLLKYEQKVQFGTCDKDDAPHPETIVKLNEHHTRIAFFSELARKDQHIKTEVKLFAPTHSSNLFYAKTEVKRGKDALQVESYLTKDLSEADLEQLVKLYQVNFSAKSEETLELQRKHFDDKLGRNNDTKQVYIDVIKSNGNIVGFNLYQIYQGQFADKPYFVVYCSLAYVDKAFRGTRVMSLLSFRGPFALKEAHPDVETYIFYDAIHPNSYRQAWKLSPRYPECRESSLDFVKHVTTQIYGAAKAKQYDGNTNFYWPTDSRVESAPIKLTEYDLPCVIEKFDEITHGHQGMPGKGGIPVMIPVISNHFQQMEHDIDQKLNNAIFRQHVKDFANLIFKSNDLNCTWNDSTECLWPDNLIIYNRIHHG